MGCLLFDGHCYVVEHCRGIRLFQRSPRLIIEQVYFRGALGYLQNEAYPVGCSLNIATPVGLLNIC